MPCFNPMIAFIKDEALDNPEWFSNKPFRFSKADKKNADLYDKLLRSGNIHSWKNPLTGFIYRDSLIPCRQCIGCRMEYSRNWANRLMLELGVHDPGECYFLTLTYAEENLPKSDKGFITFEPLDVTLFLKRLRDHQDRLQEKQGVSKEGRKYLRYYYSSEYGDLDYHSHYHMIVFSLVIPDLKFLKFTDAGHPIYTSFWLDSIWDKGYVFIESVAWENCAYTAGYVMKKLKGKESERYDKVGILPEFARMSRRPGIGSQSFSIANFEKGILRYVNGRPVTVPDSWKRLMLDSCEKELADRIIHEEGIDGVFDKYGAIRDSKSLLQRLKFVQTTGSDYLPSERLEIQEKELKEKNKNFYRRNY